MFVKIKWRPFYLLVLPILACKEPISIIFTKASTSHTTFKWFVRLVVQVSRSVFSTLWSKYRIVFDTFPVCSSTVRCNLATILATADCGNRGLIRPHRTIILCLVSGEAQFINFARKLTEIEEKMQMVFLFNFLIHCGVYYYFKFLIKFIY